MTKFATALPSTGRKLLRLEARGEDVGARDLPGFVDSGGASVETARSSSFIGGDRETVGVELGI